MKFLSMTLVSYLLMVIVYSHFADAAPPDYPEAHPPTGTQPKRPAGYEPFTYPRSSEDLLRTETPAMLERAHAAWDAAEAEMGRGPYKPEHDSIAAHPCPEWFLDAKFGMFIDWGPWSVAGWAPQAKLATYPDWYEQKLLKEYRDYHLKTWGEDVRPDDLIQLLRPDEFHPEKFASLARDSGMRYVVPFLKHHGGYSLWNSTFTHRNSVEWGLKHDFAKELSTACQASGLRYGVCVPRRMELPNHQEGRSLYLRRRRVVDPQPGSCSPEADGRHAFHCREDPGQRLLSRIFNAFTQGVD